MYGMFVLPEVAVLSSGGDVRSWSVCKMWAWLCFVLEMDEHF